MIPKIIHYCWFGGKKIPYDVKLCIKSWEKYCPDYEIKRWDESNFDVNSHPFMKTAYKAKAWAFVSDYARLKVVYDYGGIYLDTDVELVKSLNSLLDNEWYLACHQVGNLINTGLGFGAKKENLVIKKLLDCYDEIVYNKENQSQITCPILNTKAINNLGYTFSDSKVSLMAGTVYPAKYFDPYPSCSGGKNLFCEDTYSIHHYSASWGSVSQQLKRKIAKVIGEDKVLRIKDILNR